MDQLPGVHICWDGQDYSVLKCKVLSAGSIGTVNLTSDPQVFNEMMIILGHEVLVQLIV